MMFRKLLLIAAVSWSTFLHAQEKDLGLWTGATFEYKVNDRFDLKLSPEIRFEENISRLGNAFGELSGSYQLLEGLNAGLTYRFGQRNKFDYFQTRQRLQFELGYKYKFENWTVGYALRYQKTLQGNFADSDPDFETVLRNKFSVKYTKIKKTDISAGWEFFHNGEAEGGLVWQNWRATLEVERKLNKRNFISLGYLIQKDLESSVPSLDYVFLVGYTHIIKKKKE